MIKPNFVLIGAVLVVFSTLPAAAVEQPFAWQFPLIQEPDSAVVRLSLTPTIVASLHRYDGRDWQIVDAGGRSVPAARLSANRLTEQSVQDVALHFEQTLVDSVQPVSAPLVLNLDQDQARLTIRAPQAATPPDDGQLLFEALIAAPSGPEPAGGRRLIMDFQASQRLELDCRLRDAADNRPASWRFPLSQIGDSRPRRYRGRAELAEPAEAWHLACYGQHIPDDFVLVEARLEHEQQIDHRRRAQITPALVAMEEDGSSLTFTLEGPQLVETLQVTSDQPNLLSQLRVQSRSADDATWQDRGELTLSTMQPDERPELQLDRPVRDRYWRLLASPALPAAPDMEVSVIVEEIAFLAQGTPPWTLLAGSRHPGQAQLDEQLLGDLVGRQGPAWAWPRVIAGERAESAGEGVLAIPAEPVPWERYLLWTILILGSGLVIGLGWRLLRPT